MSPMSSGDLFCNQRPWMRLRNATPGATPKRNRYGSASTQLASLPVKSGCLRGTIKHRI
ncbi:hypothetical protein [Oryza sativa Japonica Group]|uniref:Uncharacterized protein n=1 Tax=Oryza sativa subsp. japonica TaxID=39947 RepID=Q5VN91_ORYSJ|nr:hypothetical protein [Oryza sativa Japonica Group]BAD69079.1 hypothetical protein [Oryza sativa Japonica Group]